MDIIYSFACIAESWIDVSSRPSSSSLSSAATDDNAQASVQNGHNPNVRRRRRSRRGEFSRLGIEPRATSAATSSQEEYEESESESDRIMTSSNEGLPPRLLDGLSPIAPLSSASDSIPSDLEDDDDENATALGVLPSEAVFTPQPNAFSHPPASFSTRQHDEAGVPGSYFPAPRPTTSRPTAQRHSYPAQRTRSHTPYNLMAPSHQADHDAVLRASLSTLFSCAAAARGLPKRDQPTRATPGASNRVEPSTLRMVPESAITGGQTEVNRPSARRSSASSSNPSIQEKGKRKASTSKDRREIKKKRRASIDEMMITPTLMTWMVSAGVVVLFSAISFSAGYAIGKEVGRYEAGLSGGSEGAACGKEVGRGLRKLRWSTTPAVVRA